MEIELPLEFVIEGVPLSSQSRLAANLTAWKGRVSAAARAVLPEGYWAVDSPLSVTLFYFPDSRMQGDLDNIIKPILDALNRLVYLDDGQIERIVAQRFEPNGLPTFVAPSPLLVSTIKAAGPRLYVRIASPAAQVTT